MVTTNPVNLARMDDERRKKASMEKAKAAHLSKQLQLRLQYARLKVDYGWQRQNLNEVENLYFHHSSQKGRLKPPLPRPHAKPAPGPPPISYPSPVHSTPHIVDVNMFQHQKEEPPPPPPPAPTPGSAFTSSQASTAEAGALPSPQASDCTMRPPPDVPVPHPAEPSTPAPDQVMLSPFAPPPPPPPDALSPSPFAPPPSPFVAAAPPNSGPPPPNPGQPAHATQPMYGTQAPAAHAQALPAAYKTFDVAAAAMPGPGGGGVHAPLTYDSFWSSHSSVGGWRRHMGRGGAAATG